MSDAPIPAAPPTAPAAAGTPGPDDLDGWIAALGDPGDPGDPGDLGAESGAEPAAEPGIAAEARGALARIERQARDAGDWERVIEIVVARVEHAAGAAERAGLLGELAEVYEVGLGDPRRAFTAILAACQAAPGDDAAAVAAERLAAATDRWAELVRDTAELAADGSDPAVAARWWTRLGGWYADRLGDADAAILRYEAAVATDGSPAALDALVRLHERAGRGADELRARERLAAAYAERGDQARHRDAVLGLTGALVAQAQAASGEAAGPLWREVDRVCREALARHGEAVPADRWVELWVWIGAAARARGDVPAAEAALGCAVERDPRHGPARRALVELAEARGDWRAAIELRRGQVEALEAAGAAPAADSAAQRARLHEQIGDVWQRRLADPGAAIAAYDRALALAPGSRGVMHKLLEAHTGQRQWRRALAVLGQLAAHEPAAERRARFHYAAAVIARDELGDLPLAIDQLGAALDADPRTAGGFEALDALWTERGDGRRRARAVRRQIERLGEAAPGDELAALWARLGDLCLDQLADGEAATAAYQIAAELAPGDPDRRERLAELHLAGGAPRRRDAIAELQHLLDGAPGRVELYKALAGLYRAEGELDAAWCVAQVLVLLGAASDDERALYARLRPARFVPAARRLTDELWHGSIAHPREDRRIGAIFAAALPAIAADTAQPAEAFERSAEPRADPDREPPVARIVRHAASVLAIDPAPVVWLDPGATGLRIANALGERGRPAPAVIAGMPELASSDERELAFAAGKRLAYLRPDRFAAIALAALPALEAALAAVIRAARPGDPPAAADAAGRRAARLRAQLPAVLREHLGELAAGLAWRPGDGAVAAWRAATDLTANRAGLIVAGDLETAARAIATEGMAPGLSVKDRLRDLLGYAASERYFAVRRHLGQRVADAAGGRAGDAPSGAP